MESKLYVEPSYVIICCKGGLFLALWQQKT